MALSSHSAYHGGSWKTRSSSHRQECVGQAYWPFSGLDSEYRPIKEVLLCRVPIDPPRIAIPERVQHLHAVNWKDLRRELGSLSGALTREGVRVHWLESGCFPGFKPNLMFVRDLFFMTPWGAILGRMASPVRAGEEKWGQAALARVGIPILGMIQGKGLFEGADALWLSPESVLVGVGNRTNAEGFRQIARVLADHGVIARPVPMPRGVQHLLGLLQLVGSRRALVRTQVASSELLRVLERSRFDILPVAESGEVIRKQGMNVLCVAPERVIMPEGCPKLRAALERSGIRVAAEVRISQLLNAAGGIACASAPLSRG